MRFLAGSDGVNSFRLSPKHSSERVIASCSNTRVYLEFKDGHWLCLYDGLWPTGKMPAPAMHTMVSDLSDNAALPSDIYNAKKQSLELFAKHLGAWVAMGFRNPKTPSTGQINV